MKILKLTLITLLLITICTFPSYVHAQLRTNSNVVSTKVGTPSTDAPPVDDANLKQALIDTFGITMNGFDSTHLRWAWEKLHEMNDTTYPSLLQGTVVQATSGISSQVGCFGGGTSLNLGQYVPEAFFKFIIVHEFGHVIQACTPREKSKVVEHANAFATEGAISYYSGHTQSCTGLTNGANEDYADTLAYYFNPAAGSSSGPGTCLPPDQVNPPNPYFVQNSFPLHLSVAKSL